MVTDMKNDADDEENFDGFGEDDTPAAASIDNATVVLEEAMLVPRNTDDADSDDILDGFGELWRQPASNSAPVKAAAEVSEQTVAERLAEQHRERRQSEAKVLAAEAENALLRRQMEVMAAESQAAEAARQKAEAALKAAAQREAKLSEEAEQRRAREAFQRSRAAAQRQKSVEASQKLKEITSSVSWVAPDSRRSPQVQLIHCCSHVC